MHSGHKQKIKSRSGWSEWQYDEARGCYYRYRFDRHGNYEYGYQQANSDAQLQIPRDAHDLVQEITESLQNLSPGSNYGTNEYSLDSGTKGKSRATTGTKDKGKSKVPHEGSSPAEAHHGHSHHKESPSSAASYKDGKATVVPQWPYYSSFGTQSPDYSYTLPPDYAENEVNRQMEQAIAASQRIQYGFRNAGESSSAAVQYSAYSAYDDAEEDYTTSLQGITAIEEDQFEQLDPRYKIEPSVRFQPGTIFKVFWSEPQGTSSRKGTAASYVSGRHETQNKFGIKFFVGFRRFVVVANDQGHCVCVPILTYGGKACTKSGVKPAKHGIIHDSNSRPRLIRGEPSLGFAPIMAHMSIEGETLSKESRVNYSKLVTVEHNVSVFFIGSVADKSWPIVSAAVDKCWYDKTHRNPN